MRFLRSFLDKQAKPFREGGLLEKIYPVYEALDTFLFTPGKVSDGPSHVRDALDLKRMMSIVVIALGPCMFMAMYNTGYQACLAVANGAAPWDGWQTRAYQTLGFEFSPHQFLGCVVYGALFFLPVYFVTLAAGGTMEVLFAVVRKHEINEGFLVTSALFPLVLPPTIPLWQVALGIMFGIVFGKEIFGGTGMNIFNPALMSRAFLYFAYPGQISGDNVWIAAQTSPDGYSGATWLAIVKDQGMEGLRQGIGAVRPGLTWWDAFLGFEPGAMGETSVLCCLIGAVVLIATGVGSWRTMLGGLLGSLVMVEAFNLFGGKSHPYFAVPFYWHWVIGGFAFAIVFMATDPVSSPFTEKGKFIYGCMIGLLGILIREVNPAYPGSWMLTILFMNMMSPLIDYFTVRANVKRRRMRYAA